MIKQILQKLTENYVQLSETALDDFVTIINHRNCKKGELLIKEGTYSKSFFFIIKGSARTYYFKNGKDITDWFAFENELICAITSLFMEIPSPHYIEVLEDSTLIEFKKKDIETLYDKHHDFERFGRLIITQTMLNLQERIVSLQFETAEQKYNYLLSKYPQIELRVPLKDIASFLGISQETLSRIRGKKSRI